MNDQAIIFCQAPIETAQVLYIYEKIKPQYKNIIIACLRTKSYIDFFKYMKLEVQYIYIPEFIFSIKHILGNIKKISEIKHYAQTININESDIYFTLNPQLHSRSATYIKRNGLLIRKITIKSSRPFQCAYHPLTP